MKVTFDSNVYRRVTEPARFPGDPEPSALQAIHAAIVAGQVVPFLSETIASLEGIKKGHRGAYFAGMQAAISVQEQCMPDGSIRIGLTMGPNNALHPGVPPVADKWLKDALALGFRFMRAPRLGGPRPSLLTASDEVYADDEDMKTRLDLFHKVGREIDARGVGFAAPKAIGNTIASRIGSSEPWFAVLDQPKDVHEEKAIQRAIGEWADGDTVAAHVGYGNDVLCSEDRGNSAGTSSIFDQANRAWLAATYAVDIITPAELAARL